MWMTLIWKIVKDPKMIAIVVLAALLAWVSVSNYVHKKEVASLTLQVSNLKTEVANLTEANKKITQNRDALAQQVEDLKSIEKKYQDIQARIDVLKKTCAQPVKAVKVAPGTPAKPKVESKPVETVTGAIVPPGVAVTPSPEATKPEEPKPEGEAVAKTEQPEPEYQYGGKEYETQAKGVYNDVVAWFNSDRVSGSTGPNTAMPSPGMSDANEASSEDFGYGQDIGSPRQLQCCTSEYVGYC